jgi:hypothetical protein
VTVSLEGPDSRTGTTDASGDFLFTNLRSGTYLVSIGGFNVTHYLFDSTAESVSVGPNETRVVDFVGSEASIATLTATVTIDGGTPPDPFTVEVTGPATRQIVTDASGQAVFDLLPRGDYEISVVGFDANLYIFDEPTVAASIPDIGGSATVTLEGSTSPCQLREPLPVGVPVTGSLGPGDCLPWLSDGETIPDWWGDWWSFDLAAPAQVLIDLMSEEFDTYLFLNPPGIEDDDGGLDTNSRIIQDLGAGSFSVLATSFAQFEQGAYDLRVWELPPPGAPLISNLSFGLVEANSSVCGGTANLFRYRFDYADADGDIGEPGGLSLRLTGVPSGNVQNKGLDWVSLDPAPDGYVGPVSVVSCEQFGSDTAKDFELWVTDAEDNQSNILTGRLEKPAGGAVPGRAPEMNAAPFDVDVGGLTPFVGGSVRRGSVEKSDTGVVDTAVDPAVRVRIQRR